MAAADTARLVAQLTLDDKGFSRGIDSAIKKSGQLDSTLAKVGSRAGRGLSTAAGNIAKLTTVGLGAGLALVVNEARNFETAFAGVRKTVEATPAEFEALSKAIREMSKEIPISAAELATLGETAGALGIEGTDNIKEFIRVTALLGVTTDLTADAAANSLGVLANVLHLTGQEYDNFASTLVALGNAGASTESQIIAIGQRSGAAAELVGLSTQEVLAFASAVASLGIEEEAGGSALQKFFIDTAGFIAEGGEELEAFAKISGTSAKQVRKNFDQDAGAALRRFLANLGKLNQGDQIRALRDLGFNDVRITRTLLGLANNTALVTEQTDLANKSFEENAALTKEAAERFKTFDSQLALVKNGLVDAGITVGTVLLPKLVEVLQRVNAGLKANQPAIEAFAAKLPDAFDKLVRFAEAAAPGLQKAAEFAGQLVDVFLNLPPEFQTTLVALAGLNKLSGGAVSGIVSELGKGLIKGVLGINAGVVQVRAGTVTGVGGGAGGAAGAAGRGGGGGILSAVTKVFLVGAAAAVIAELASVRGAQSAANVAQAAGTVKQATVYVAGANIDDLRKNLAGLRERQAYLTNNLTPEAIAYQLDIDGVKTTTERVIAELQAKLTSLEGDNAVRQNTANERLDAIRAEQAKTAAALPPVRSEMIRVREEYVRSAGAISSKIQSTNSELQLARISAAQNAASQKATTAAGLADVRGAIQRKNFAPKVSVTVNNQLSISVRDQIKQRKLFHSVFHHAE